MTADLELRSEKSICNVAVTLFFVASDLCWILGNDWVRLSDLSCSIPSFSELTFLQSELCYVCRTMQPEHDENTMANNAASSQNDALKSANKEQDHHACSVINLPTVNWGDTLFNCPMGTVRMARSQLLLDQFTLCLFYACTYKRLKIHAFLKITFHPLHSGSNSPALRFSMQTANPDLTCGTNHISYNERQSGK